MTSQMSCSGAERSSISWGARALGQLMALGSLVLLFASACGEPASPPDGAGGADGLAGSGGTSWGGAAAAGGMGGSTPDGSGGSTSGPAPESCVLEGGLFAEGVHDFSFGTGQDVGQDQFPQLVLGAPRGAGESAGSTSHVVALGDGGFVTLSFGVRAIVDGTGVDFIVFENPFFVGGDSANPYAELGRVSVSQDGEEWFAFPCTADEYPYGTCAGWHPVLANADENELDATVAEEAGGDPFDLEEVGLEWARFVRIDDITDEQELAFDLDAVSVVHAGCF